MPATLLPLELPRAPDDASLLDRAKKGEEFALDLLYRRHAPFVAAVALRLGRREADVEDIVQETFLLAFSRLDQLLHAGALRGWLASIAVSFVHRRLRFSKWLRLFKTDAEAELTLSAMVSPAAGPELTARIAELDEKVRALPLHERTAWTMRFVLGCTLEETAQACRCSLATAKRRLAAARAAVGTEVEVEVAP
ncbi:MAG: sigma-70 family RNA polymerase sigma factor [Myxococcaceae bacterium]|nr:sigma-70 family RNA polymerase sigma factor [Myxococcaceae bacterium]